MSEKPAILYFYTSESPFVEKDIEILAELYTVRRYRFDVYQKKAMLRTVLAQVLFLLRHIWGSRLVVCQFAGFHSFFPVLFARLAFKKAVVVAGGTDCVSFPSIRYGNFANTRNRFFTAYCFKKASLILPVHESLVLTGYTYQDKDYPKQGMKYFIPELRTRTVTIYNGYDAEQWVSRCEKKPASFVTMVAYVHTTFTLQLKGIDLFIGLARQFPQATFSIIGGSGIKLNDLPPNLELLPPVWGPALVDVVCRNRFYVQLSMSEGFPNSLSEAMLCECVPIVSAVGGMPDIVKDCGYILHRKDEAQLHALVQSALGNQNTAELGRRARQNIMHNYSLERRRQAFKKAVSELLRP